MKKVFKMCILFFILLLVFAVVVLFFNLKSNFGKIPSPDEVDSYSKLDYYKNGEFQSPHEIVYHFEKLPTSKFNMFLKFLSKSPNAPKEELPMVKPSFSINPQNFAIYWLGHSNVILELDGKRLIIDPVFGNAGPISIITPRYSKPPVELEKLPSIDYILITHNHYDHLEKKTVTSIKNGHFIVPLGVGALLRGWGVDGDRITEIGWNKTFKVDSISITALPTIHYSGRGVIDKNKTLWAAYVIKSTNKNIFWSGDSGYGSHFAEYGKKYGPFDFAALEIDAWNEAWPNIHLFPDEVIKSAIDLKTEYILPIHWGVFDLAMHPWHESIDIVLEEASKNNISVLTPMMGEKIENIKSPIKKWW